MHEFWFKFSTVIPDNTNLKVHLSSKKEMQREQMTLVDMLYKISG
jgi:hypothetical protein